MRANSASAAAMNSLSSIACYHPSPVETHLFAMRLTPSFAAALLGLAVLSACGTKTPLTLPQPTPQASTTAVPPAPDHNNKAVESRP
ncbi:LPS translocon maturation chaperone LptM [Sulfuritalea sp.]|uniref:LPS translocon maturation chaperone LptM n=1 Tax=Sulfuritalea sp. TaxID=2480090 RepID=UPI003918B040